MPIFRDYRDPLEKSTVAEVEKKWRACPDTEFQKICYELADKLTLEHGKLAVKIKTEYERFHPTGNVPWWFAIQWKKNNSKAGITIN